MDFKRYKLKDLIENFSVRAKDYGGSEGLEFLGVSNEDGIVKSKYAAEGKAEEYKIIEKGCFAYNPYRINVGSIAYLNEDIRGLISPAYVVFKTKENTIKDNLLFKFLKSAEGLRQIKFHGRGTVRQALRFEDLCKIEIAIPNYEEQEILISNIENTEFESNLISTELTHQLDLIKQLRQAFLREAMQGKLFGSAQVKEGSETGHELLAKIKAEKAQLITQKKLKKEKELPPIAEDEIPFEIPEHLICCRLGDYFSVEKGLVGIQKAIEGKIPLVVTSENRLTHNEFHFKGKAVIVPLVSSTGHGHASMKRIHYQEGEFAVGNILACIMPLFPEFFNMRFIFNYLDTYKEFYFVDKMKGGANVSLKISSIKETPIPIIPIEIQNRYEDLIKVCDSLEKSIKESQEYNEKLLQQVLREALQAKTETKVVALESRKLALPLKTILGAYIVDVCNTTDFGRVKFQKLLFLTEYHCKIDFDSHYVQKTAGPHDDVLIKSIEGEFMRQRFFKVKQEESDLHRVRYTKLPNASQINSMFLDNFSEESLKVNNLLMKMRTFNWEECEVIATIYAVWNNRLLKGQTITDDILFEDFMAWSSRKSNLSKDFYKKLFWMKEENIIPDGWGKYVEKPDKKMA